LKTNSKFQRIPNASLNQDCQIMFWTNKNGKNVPKWPQK
jgi:hypothetical protein